jgi:methylamine dehydrogenase accessory protein MauD
LQIAFVISSVLLWVVVLFNLLLTLALIKRVNAQPRNQAPEEPEVPRDAVPKGTEAPNFSAHTLAGETVTRDSYKGQPTMLIFVTPTCKPCRELLPILKQLAPQAKRAGVNLILVSGDMHEATQQMIDKEQIDLPVLLAPRHENTLWLDYKISGTPSFYFIDAQGIVRASGFPSPYSERWKKLLTTPTLVGAQVDN